MNEAGLTQVQQEEASVKRVPRGEDPMFEFHLEPHQQIVGTFHYWTTDERGRETVDHHIIVWVATTL